MDLEWHVFVCTPYHPSRGCCGMFLQFPSLLIVLLHGWYSNSFSWKITHAGGKERVLLGIISLIVQSCFF